jgi:glycosyltransferase involved in cell wall biosynthesis
LRRLAEDDALAERLRAAARRWVEEHYDAHRNAAQLHACFEKAARGNDLQTPMNQNTGAGP